VAGLRRCVAKLSRISAGEWTVADARVSCRTMGEAVKDPAGSRGVGAGVYFEVGGDMPFTSMIIFRPEDGEILSRGFLGFSFTKLPGLNQAHELLLSELGNIILNSLVSSLSNALKRSFLPSAPKCVQGEPQFLLEALWTTAGDGAGFDLVTVTLDLKCGGTMTRSEVLALLPDGMEKALAAASAG
jgi:chemotaxis protein CheY-P-specific phosphatase CheC